MVPATIALALVTPLLAVLLGGSALSASAGASASSAAAVRRRRSAPARSRSRRKYKPPVGVVFNDPLIPGARGNVLDQVIARDPQHPQERVHPARGLELRRALADQRADRAPRSAARSSSVVTAGSVDSRSFKTLAKFLLQNPNDKSFAKKCKGACRSNSKIMHAKIFMFSKVGKDQERLACSGRPT